MPVTIRPTQNIVRKAVFDFLGQDMTGLTFLDLFSGSGAMGLEAISRGAQKAVFVEKDHLCAKVIEENITLLKIGPYENYQYPYEVIQADSFGTIREMERQKRQFDIIYIDPPYEKELGKKALKLLDTYGIVHPNSWVMIEHQKREILPESVGRFSLFREKKYGNKIISIYKIQNSKP